MFNTNGTSRQEFNIKDHLGNVRVVYSRVSNANVSQQVDTYYPFGMNIKGLTATKTGSTRPNEYLYNGKMSQDEMGLALLDYGARMYDPVLGRWSVVDPLAEKNRRWGPYCYSSDDPINRFDPDGMTDFTLNQKTGAVTQVGDANNAPDRILKTDSKGNVKTKGTFLVRKSEQGKPKVAIGGIEKGILKNGQNFKNNDQVISVGGVGQPTVEGVKSFTLQLSEYIGKEIKGFSYSSNASGNVTDMVLGKYLNNTFTESRGSVTELYRKYGDKFSFNNVLQEFHTHPNGELGATQSAPDQSQDVKSLQMDKPLIPNATFIILYRITGQDQPGEYDYTHEYKP